MHLNTLRLPTGAAADLENAYRLIASDLTAMEDLAGRSLRSVDPFVEEVVRYSFRFGGKRLRPVLLFLSRLAASPHALAKESDDCFSSQYRRAATAIEFVHTASLIHDDILDGASIRRHLATVNVRWDTQIGVLAGDVVLTRAMQLLLVEDDLYGFRSLTDACRKTCEGELRQIGTIDRFNMSPEEYFEMIAGKTAPLLACATELGAYYSGADAETIERFRLFGHKLGLAFQIIDDVLDFSGETDDAGKTLHTDLINHKPTLPLILFLRQCGETERTRTLDRIQADRFDEEAARPIIRRVCDSGVVETARSLAEETIRDAIELISPPGRQENREAIDGLISVASFVVRRKH